MIRFAAMFLAVSISLPSFAQSRVVRDFDAAVSNIDYAKNSIIDLKIDNDEADISTLVGLNNINYIVSDLGNIRFALVNSDTRLAQVKRDFERLSQDISIAVERFNKNASRYCDETNYAQRIGRTLNDISEFSQRAAQALAFSFQTEKSKSLKDICAPYPDGQ